MYENPGKCQLVILEFLRFVKPMLLLFYVQRTHSQVSPDDAVVRAPLSDAAAVRRPSHAHGAAPPVVLWTCIRLQHCCKTHIHTHTA